VCDIIAGQHIESALYSGTEDGHPYLTGPADFGDTRPIVTKWTKHPKVFAAFGDVLVTVKGAGVGKINLGCNAAIGRQLMALRPRLHQIDQAYLFQVLRAAQRHINGLAQGATVPGIGKDDLASLEAYIPPLAEQKRIAGILDAADALRGKRREALAQLDTLLQATFLDLFGDPVTNPKGWKFVPLGEAGTSFEGGKNYNPTDDERPDGFRVLKVSAVTSGEYLYDESKPFAQAETVPADYIVRDSDLLISRANTSELVGAVAHVRNASGREVLPDKLWRFVWSKPRQIEPLYMLHIARSKYFRRQLIQRATGTSGSMKNIGKEKMLGIPIPLPPLARQQQFAQVAELIDAQKGQHRAHLTELDALFASLQSRAFKGEL
jgi:type I restriction enzyme S subunit